MTEEERMIHKARMCLYPDVAVAIVSYNRPERLIETLRQFIEDYPNAHLTLKIVGMEELNENPTHQFKERLADVMHRYKSHTLSMVAHNKSVGESRLYTTSRARRTGCKYIITLDDDMNIPSGSVSKLVDAISLTAKIGAVGMFHQPGYAAGEVVARVEGDSTVKALTERVPETGFNKMGWIPTAFTIIRSEVFDKEQFDPKLSRLEDIDFFLRVSKHFDVFCLRDENMQPENDHCADTREYKKNVRNMRQRKELHTYIADKHGIKVNIPT